MDLAAATALSDLLDLERESLLRRHAAGRLSYTPWDLASVAETGVAGCGAIFDLAIS